MVQHIVLLKLKAAVTAAQTDALLRGLEALRADGAIAGIESVSGGYDSSPEGKARGYGWGFVMTFTDASARNAYLPHPDHQALAQTLVRPIAEEVLVLDYEF